MKRFYGRIMVALILGCSLLCSSAVFAAEDAQVAVKQTYSFDQAELEAGWELARSQPIYADKSMGFAMVATRKTDPNTYPTRKGVILVTSDKYKGLIPLGHAAIIMTASTVVESVAQGVVTGRNDWNVTRNTCYGVTPYDTTPTQDSQAANYCYGKIGKPYNYNYPNKWTRSSFYCSQLVYAAFKDLFSIDLDTSAYLSCVHPMELVNTSKTYTIYTK